MRCTFCGIDIVQGTGMMYVKKDGKLMYFCSHKCEKNMLKLNRKPLRVQWTADYKKVKASAKASAEAKK